MPRPTTARASASERHPRPLALATLLAAAFVLAVGAVAPAARHRDSAGCPPGTAPHPTKERPLTHPNWLTHTVVTEYWPVPEQWFGGRPVAAPGLPGLHRVDWLYSARGLPMEGDGVGLNGHRYHFGGPWHLEWVNPAGESTTPCNTGFWTNGRPFWPAFGWRNAAGAVTFPLAAGGWSNGDPAHQIPPPKQLRFLTGPSLPLHYWQSIAVDSHLIPLGSRVFIPAFCNKPNRGWFVAADTGGTVISGHHVDVYRPTPATPNAGEMLTDQRMFVIPRTYHGRLRLPQCD